MKTKLRKISVVLVCLIAMAMSANAQSSCYFYLRDANAPPNTYQVYISVWDNALGAWLTPSQYGPIPCYVDQYNTVPTPVVVTPDTSPRYRIVIQVDKTSTPTGTQYRQSGLLTSAQYNTGYYIPILLNPITF